jgi:hypothetical protein
MARVGSSDSRKVLAMSLAVVALLVLYLWVVHGSSSRLLLSLGFGEVPLHDYFYFFYPMGEKLLREPKPVEGFLYSPFAALFFVPFGRAPYQASAFVWALILLFLVAWLAREAARLGSKSPALAVLGVALMLSSFPLLHDLKFGQVSILIVALLWTSAVLYDRGQGISAAACLAFAAAFKAYPLFFLSYFVVKRDLRFVATTLGFLLVLLVFVPVVALGSSDTWAFYVDVASQLDTRFGAGVADVNSQSFASLGERLVLRPLGLDSSPFHALFTTFRYALCGVLLFGLSRFVRRPEFSTRDAFLWLFLATPFVVATSWPHYFVYLPLAVVGTLAMLPRVQVSKRRRGIALGGSAIAAVLSNIVFFDCVNDRKLYATSGLLFLANLAAIVALGALVTSGCSGMRSARTGRSGFVTTTPSNR